ncbi:MAG: hypothetical protein Q9198_001803 [Flavoplaca austrocitrina]
MSFGGSAADIALLVKLAYKTAQGARAACGEYDELTRETSSLHTILNRLSLEVAKPDSSINRQRSYRRELESIGTGCQEVLTQLDKILVKYNALSEQERSARRLWKKIRFGSGVVAAVAELRSRVTYYISALSLLLNLISVGTVGAVEKRMDQAGGDLRDIKTAVNQITAHFLSTERQEESVLTAYTNDDRDAWRELRRGLVKSGFRDSLVRTHMNTIMAYVKELGDRGILDEIQSDEADLPINSDSEEDGESPDVNQKAVSSLVLGSYVREDNPSANPEDGNQQEHLPQSEDKSPTSPSNELGSRSEARVTSKGDSGQLFNDRASADPSKGLSKSTFTVQQHELESNNSKKYQLLRQVVSDTLRRRIFLRHNNLRYFSSNYPLSNFDADLIFLVELQLPHFIADDSVIHSINVPIGSNGLGLKQLLRSIRYRLISISFHEDSIKHPKDSKARRHRLSMSKQAVSLLLHLRFPEAVSFIYADSIESLDFRRLTTLCSVFAADYIRAVTNPVQDPVVDLQDLIAKLQDWQAEFDRSLPNDHEQLQQHYGTSLLYLLTQEPGVAVRVRKAKKLLKELPAPEGLRWYHYPRLFADVTRYPPWLPPAAWESSRLRSERTPEG